MRMGLEGMVLLSSLGSLDEGSGELGETLRPPLGSGPLAHVCARVLSPVRSSLPERFYTEIASTPRQARL